MAIYSSGLAVIVAYLTYLVFLSIKRLHFHPLSGFPDPAVAGATRLYKAYIEVIAQRSWVDTIEALHVTYGKTS